MGLRSGRARFGLGGPHETFDDLDRAGGFWHVTIAECRRAARDFLQRLEAGWAGPASSVLGRLVVDFSECEPEPIGAPFSDACG